jgi:hypothetical protein
MHRYQNESGDLGQSIASEATRDRGQYSHIDAFSSSISIIAAIVRDGDTKNRLEIEVPEKCSVSGRGGTKTTCSGREKHRVSAMRKKEFKAPSATLSNVSRIKSRYGSFRMS